MGVSGLEGVVAATTSLSEVDGERGELVIAGYPVDELAGRATFEETTWLLWHGRLPTASELDGFRSTLAAERELPATTLRLLRDCAHAGGDPMDALRIAAGTISMTSQEAPAILARFRSSSPPSGACARATSRSPRVPTSGMPHSSCTY
jgi:citrate synthase